MAKFALPHYRWGRMHKFIEEHLLNLVRGELPSRRLMIFTPPQHFKSTLVSSIFPAWLLMTDPRHKIITLSFETSLARTHSKVGRDLVEEFGVRLTGTKVDPEARSLELWRTVQGGYYRAASILGSVTGRAAQTLIIDDPLKGDLQANSPTIRDRVFKEYMSVARTRLHPEGNQIIVCTRWHPLDLCGTLLDHEGDKWTQISLPALAHENDQLGRKVGEPLLPERYPLTWYQERQREYEEAGLAHQWDALYDCDPSSNNAFQEFTPFLGPHLFSDVEQMPPPDQQSITVLGIDPSKTSSDKFGDYSAFSLVTLDRQNHVWIRCWMQRSSANEVANTAVQIIDEYRPRAMTIETTWFQSLFQDNIARQVKERNLPCTIHSYQPKQNLDKKTKIRIQLGHLLQQKRLHIVNGNASKLFYKQLQDFPNPAAHDDGPDSTCMALSLINQLLPVRI